MEFRGLNLSLLVSIFLLPSHTVKMIGMKICFELVEEGGVEPAGSLVLFKVFTTDSAKAL